MASKLNYSNVYGRPLTTPPQQRTTKSAKEGTINTNDNIETANNAALLTEASTHARKTTNTEETDENADKNAKENGDDNSENSDDTSSSSSSKKKIVFFKRH